MSLSQDGVWKAGVWATTVWADGVWREGEPPPQPEPEVVVDTRAVRGRRYRVIEDPDKLLEELKQEEKVVAKEKKRLKKLVIKAAGPSVEGVMYQRVQTQIEKLEAKIDERQQKIAELASLIQTRFDEIAEDDEEVLLLS